MQKQNGFTIVELLIIIALIGIVTAIAIPNFMQWLPNYRLRAATQDLLSNFQKAKLAAVKGNVNVAVCFKNDNSGYTAFVDANANYVNDGEEVLANVAWDSYKSLVVDLNPPFNTFDTTAGGRPCMAFQPTSIPTDASAGGFASREAEIGNSNGKTTKLVVSPAGSVYLE